MTENFPVRPVSQPLNRARIATIGWSILLLLAFLFLLRVLVQPDPDGRLIWARAQRLEAANLIRPALRQYDLLANTYPSSPYALKALQREGDILTDLAIAGDTTRYADALDVYARLVRDYPQTEIAADAMLSIGTIQLDDLKNLPLARATYTRLMTDYPGKRPLVAQAMNALGRVAQAARDGKTAQSWFQKVLLTFPDQPDRCAEAQFHLGETYETLWRKKDWARNAYDATVQKYPNTVWAGRARTNLGLLIYGDMVPNARRVLIKTSGIFDGGAQDSSDSLLNALQVVLAARGLNLDAATLNGLSQQPFVGAFDAQNPALVAAPQLNAFENAVAATGMTYSVSDGGDKDTARRNLQNEIDTAHLSLVYTGQWQFVAGYDSNANVVFLQSGARVQAISVVDFIKSWSVRSPLGGAFTLLTFSTGADDLHADQLTLALPVDRILFTRHKDGAASSTRKSNNAVLPNPVAAQTTPIPIGTQMTQQPQGLVAPTWVFTAPSLDEKAVYRRGVRRAVLWMNRPRAGQTLLNLEALRLVSSEFQRAADFVQPAAPAATPATGSGDEPLARNDAVAPDTTNTVSNAGTHDAATPQATPNTSPDTSSTGNAMTKSPATAPVSKATPDTGAQILQHVRAMLAWRNQPLVQWIAARRDAASFLNVAGDRLGSPALKQAAQNFDLSTVSLQNAQQAMDDLAALDASGNFAPNGALSTQARTLLLQAANSLDAARQQEAQATALMAQI